MNAGEVNLGIPNLLSILDRYSQISVTRFDVRNKCEVPGLDYDIYISSGGPGSPLEGDGLWDRAFYNLMDKLWRHNERNRNKKYVFFICHSFQMMANHLSLGSLVLRKKEAFGVYNINLTHEGEEEVLFKGLDNPFCVADFRKWQFIEKNDERIEDMDCKVLALEKVREHIPLERAVMAMRFSEEWIGTQFHPEADPTGMRLHFEKEEKKKLFIDKRDEDKYDVMMERLENKDKLLKSYKTILPSWINQCIQKINLQTKLQSILND